MALPQLTITKNWFLGTATQEANWDNIRSPLVAWCKIASANERQIVRDAFGVNYQTTNNGVPYLATDLQTQINNILAGSDTFDSVTIIDDVSDGGFSNKFTYKWNSPTPATNDYLMLNFLSNSNTTQNSIESQIRFYTEDVTHASRSSAISFYVAGSGTPQERFRIAGNGDILFNTGSKLRLDGNVAGDTSIRESAANTIMFQAGNVDGMRLTSGQLSLLSGVDFGAYSDAGTTLKFFLDSATGSFGVPTGAAFHLNSTSLAGTCKILDNAGAFDLYQNSNIALKLGTGAVTIGTGAVRDLILRTTGRLYFDNGVSTYIEWSGSQLLMTRTGSENIVLSSGSCSISGANLLLSATKAISLGNSTSFNSPSTDTWQLSFASGVVYTINSSRITSTLPLLLPAVDPPTANEANRNSTVKVWGSVNSVGTLGSPNYNIASSSRTTDPGEYNVVFDTNFNSAGAPTITTAELSANHCYTIASSALTTDVTVYAYDETGALANCGFSISCFGTQ